MILQDCWKFPRLRTQWWSQVCVMQTIVRKTKRWYYEFDLSIMHIHLYMNNLRVDEWDSVECVLLYQLWEDRMRILGPDWRSQRRCSNWLLTDSSSCACIMWNGTEWTQHSYQYMYSSPQTLQHFPYSSFKVCRTKGCLNLNVKMPMKLAFFLLCTPSWIPSLVIIHRIGDGLLQKMLVCSERPPWLCACSCCARGQWGSGGQVHCVVREGRATVTGPR